MKMRKGPSGKRVKANGFDLTIQRYSQKVAKLFADHKEFVERNILEHQEEAVFANNVRAALQAAFSVMFTESDLTLPDFRRFPEAMEYLDNTYFLDTYKDIHDPYHDTGLKLVIAAEELRAAKKQEQQKPRTSSPNREKRSRPNDEVAQPSKRSRTEEKEEKEEIVREMTKTFLKELLEENKEKINTQMTLEHQKKEYANLHKVWLKEEKRRIEAEEAQKEMRIKIRSLEEEVELHDQKRTSLEQSLKKVKRKNEKMMKVLKKRLSKKEYIRIRRSGVFSPASSSSESESESESSDSQQEDAEDLQEPCPVEEVKMVGASHNDEGSGRN